MPACTTAAGSRSTGSTPRRSRSRRSRASLAEADGILIPGGFGGRGFEGKIRAAQIARENKIPYLGICLGMQVAVSEFARHAVGMEGANSTEMDPETPFPVIDLLPEQKEIADMGGTMRLGADPVKLHDGTRVRELYDEPVVYERHRHRYEVNNHLRRRLEAAGLICSGTSPDERLVEVIELSRDEHPFFVASQYHPEFKSRPERPAPLFREFVGSALASVRGGRRQRRRARAARRTLAVRRSTEAERARLNDTFVALCRIHSPSGHERPCADHVAAELRAMGLEVDEDDAGPAAGADAGNLFARIPGAGPDSIMMCAHLDTVPRDGAPSIRCWSTAATRTPTTRSSAPTTRPPSPSCSSSRAGAGVGIEPTGGWPRADLHRLGGERSARGPGIRHRTFAQPLRLHVRPRLADRRDRARLADPPAGDRPPPRRRRPRRPAARGRPQRDRRRRARDRRDAARPARSGDDRERRARSRGGTATNVVPEHCRIEAEVRGLSEERVEAALTDMIDCFQDAADAAECDLDLTVEKMFTGYRLKPTAPHRRARRTGAAATAATSRVRSSPAAARTRTRSSQPGLNVSTSPTGPSATTGPTSASASTRSRACLTSRSR